MLSFYHSNLNWTRPIHCGWVLTLLLGVPFYISNLINKQVRHTGSDPYHPWLPIYINIYPTLSCCRSLQSAKISYNCQVKLASLGKTNTKESSPSQTRKTKERKKKRKEKKRSFHFFKKVGHSKRLSVRQLTISVLF